MAPPETPGHLKILYDCDFMKGKELITLNPISTLINLFMSVRKRLKLPAAMTRPNSCKQVRGRGNKGDIEEPLL